MKLHIFFVIFKNITAMKVLRLTTMWALLMAAAQMSAQKPIVWADPVTIEPGGVSEVVLNIDLDTDEKIINWFVQVRLSEGVLVVPDGYEYDGHYYGDDIERVSLSPELYEQDYEWLEPDRIVINRGKKTGITSILWMGYELFGWYSPMKNTHGEMVRFVVYSSLDETLTFTPEITDVTIQTDKFETIVSNNVLQDLPSHNVLYVEDAEAILNSEFTLSVKMRNEKEIEGFGFDLVLPGGMSVVKDDEGNMMVSLSEERTTAARTNTFEVRQMSNAYNDVVRVVAASSNGSAIAPGDGEVCTVRVRMGTGMKEGKYYAQITNISLADTEANSLDRETVEFTITALAHKIGDANGDGNVTVADMTAIAHHVLGNTPASFSATAADVNQDGQVNVADYTAVAHLLLYGSIDRPAGSREPRSSNSASLSNSAQNDIAEQENMVYMNPATVIAGEEAELSVRMKNAVDAEGFQFALTLPEGVSVVRDADGFAEATLSTERTTAARTNTFATSILPDGTLKVMAASTNGSAIGAGDGEVCTVKIKVNAGMAEGDYALLLSDVAISDTHAKSYNVEPLETKLTVNEASGISEIVNRKTVNRKYFDLQGRLSDKPQKGVYIEDGRKYVK